jgi:hypothetical protein
VILGAWYTFLWITRGFSDTQNCPHVLFINYTIQVKVFLIRKPYIVERYLIVLSALSKCHSLMFVLYCKFKQHCHSVWTKIQITFQHSLHRSSGYPYLCCRFPCCFTGASLQRHSDSVNALRRTHKWRSVIFPLQHWTIIIKLVIKFMNRFEIRRPSRLKMGTKPPLCDNTVFLRCSTVFLCQLSYVNWCMDRNSETLLLLERLKTNLHYLCYHVTKHSSLHGWIFNTKLNTGLFRAPLCSCVPFSIFISIFLSHLAHRSSLISSYKFLARSQRRCNVGVRDVAEGICPFKILGEERYQWTPYTLCVPHRLTMPQLADSRQSIWLLF